MLFFSLLSSCISLAAASVLSELQEAHLKYTESINKLPLISTLQQAVEHDVDWFFIGARNFTLTNKIVKNAVPFYEGSQNQLNGRNVRYDNKMNALFDKVVPQHLSSKFFYSCIDQVRDSVMKQLFVFVAYHNDLVPFTMAVVNDAYKFTLGQRVKVDLPFDATFDDLNIFETAIKYNSTNTVMELLLKQAKAQHIKIDWPKLFTLAHDMNGISTARLFSIVKAMDFLGDLFKCEWQNPFVLITVLRENISSKDEATQLVYALANGKKSVNVMVSNALMSLLISTVEQDVQNEIDDIPRAVRAKKIPLPKESKGLLELKKQSQNNVETVFIQDLMRCKVNMDSWFDCQQSFLYCIRSKYHLDVDLAQMPGLVRAMHLMILKSGKVDKISLHDPSAFPSILIDLLQNEKELKNQYEQFYFGYSEAALSLLQDWNSLKTVSVMASPLKKDAFSKLFPLLKLLPNLENVYITSIAADDAEEFWYNLGSLADSCKALKKIELNNCTIPSVIPDYLRLSLKQRNISFLNK